MERFMRGTSRREDPGRNIRSMIVSTIPDMVYVLALVYDNWTLHCKYDLRLSSQWCRCSEYE
jgi:hypothetical protein